MNTEDFCTYEQALALKKLGFRDKCLYHYNILNEFVPNNFNAEDETVTVDDLYDSLNKDTLSDIVCDVPTLAQAQKWFREVKGTDIEPRIWLVGGKREYRPYVMPPKCKDYIACPPKDTYELALSAGIDAALELLTDNTK